jgi:hypothetical protein
MTAEARAASAATLRRREQGKGVRVELERLHDKAD